MSPPPPSNVRRSNIDLAVALGFFHARALGDLLDHRGDGAERRAGNDLPAACPA